MDSANARRDASRARGGFPAAELPEAPQALGNPQCHREMLPLASLPRSVTIIGAGLGRGLFAHWEATGREPVRSDRCPYYRRHCPYGLPPIVDSTVSLAAPVLRRCRRERAAASMPRPYTFRRN